MNSSEINSCSLFLGMCLLAGCGDPHRDLQSEEIWSRVSPSVVRLEAKGLNGGVMIGSGFVCELNGKKVILSNRHVVLGAKEVRVGSSAERLFPSPGYRISPKFDLALIDIPDEIHIAPLKTRTVPVRIGERIYALGFPLGLNKSITQGLVSSETDNLVQFDASISSGNSGGPLVDRDGIALGVVTAGSTSSSDQIAQNLNFAIKTTFVPKAELFKQPILRFYDAWRELAKIENNLIDQLKDRRIFDVETCAQAEIAEPFSLATDAKFGRQIVGPVPGECYRLVNASMRAYPDCADRVTERYGSLGAGVTNAVAFLRSKVSEFDKIPEIFVGIGSDELLEGFGRDQRIRTLYTWDIKPSEIVPLLKVSIEFTKAHYEDLAYKIEFYYQMYCRIKSGDTNLLAILPKADEHWIGERRTVRLPYEKLGPRSTDEERVRTFFLSNQIFGHRSNGPWLKRNSFLATDSLIEGFSEYGGFETWITSMLFGKRSMECLERGEVQTAIEYEMNEVEVRRYPDLGCLAFLYACKGDFEKAYDLYGKAYMNTFAELDAFSLQHEYSLRRRFLLLDFIEDQRESPYPTSIKGNLKAWTDFISKKSAFSLAQSAPKLQPERSTPRADANISAAVGSQQRTFTTPPDEAIQGTFRAPEEEQKLYRDKLWASTFEAKIGSGEFDHLSDFEKCWVLQAHFQNAATNDRLAFFREVVKANPQASKLCQMYIELQ
jgi:hypothetical protein